MNGIEVLGELEAVVVGEGDGPVVVMLHGFGAPGDDLVPLADAIEAPAGTRYVFPAAPEEIEGYGGGRAWWSIDIERMQREAMGGRARDRSGEVPDGLREARARVNAACDAALQRLGARADQLILAGFSQGAMLACDVALHRAGPLAGLALLSGTLIAQGEWAPRLTARRGLPVLQSHGRSDPLLPFAAAERLRDLLSGGGLKVEFVPFRGGHEIPPVVLDRLGAFLVARAGHA